MTFQRRRPLAALSSLVASYYVKDHPEMAYLATRSGQALTHTRATTAPTVDANGTAQTVQIGQPRFSTYDLDGDTVRESLGLFVGVGGGGVDPDVIRLVPGWGVPEAETWYVKLVRPAHADTVGALGWPPYVLSRGTGARLALAFRDASRLWVASIDDGTNPPEEVTAAIPAGAILEACVQFDLLNTAPRCRIDTGSGFGAWSANTLSPITSLPGNLAIGDDIQAPGDCLEGAFLGFGIDNRLATFAEMQAAR